MEHLRVALGLFRALPLRDWPGFAYYLLGWATFRIFRVRLFQQRRLRLNQLTILAEASGQSGLIFLHEILVRHIYDYPELRAAPAPRVVFDVGANCGFFTLHAATQWPDARLIAIEPHPVSFQRLEENLRVNGLEKRVTTVAAAAGAESGSCQFAVSGDSSMGHVAAAGTAPTEKLVRVPLVSLDDCARAQSVWPDLMKIDVEGFEVEVLKGARSCLEHARFAIVEIHSEELAAQTLALLRASGFQARRDDALIFGGK
jgi:FkbM family methyltransferase